jgi:K+-sensing histidine kinase KdpD
MLLVVLVLLILVFYGFKKLKQSTTYNNWITTALSHDLRSPVSHILYALDRDNGVYLAKSNLISYEYLLDDTLNMAVYVHGNQKPVFKLIDLTELVDELLQDLNYIITNKQLVVENKLSAEMIVNGDFNGLKILLRNVLLNAIKHNKEGGYIRIESAKKEAAGLTIENSVDSKTMSSKPTAGSQIIQFFAKQNKANYQFKMESDKAVALVVFG